MLTGFMRELIAYWRDPKDKWVKVAVYVGVILHISVLVSVKTGCWDEYFFKTTNNKLIQACDFFAIYVAGHDLLEGRTIYSSMDDNPDYLEIVPYFYPFRYLPVAAYVGVALNLFEPWTAYFLWIILSEILFLGCIAVLGHHFGTMRHIHIAAAMYLIFVPFYAELFLGQFNLMQSVLILGMILSAASGRMRGMHWFWTLSVLWKINTVLCIPAMLRWRTWKQVIWLMLIVAITCAPYFVMHFDDITKFFFTNVRIPGRLDLAQMGIEFRFADVEAVGNVSVQGLIARSTMQRLGLGHLVVNPFYNFISWGIFMLIGIMATIRAGKSRLPECLCMWVVMYFMVYTNVWEFHYLMLLPVITFLYLKYQNNLLLITYALLVIPPRHLGYANLLPNWEMPWIKPIGALLLFGYCVYAALRAVEETSESKVVQTNPSSADTTAGSMAIIMQEPES